MTSLVVRKVIDKCGVLKLRLVRVGPKVVSEGVLKFERVRVTCPACGQQVEAVAADGRVKGYCAAAKQYVDFPVTQGMAVPVGSQANAVASVTAATAVHTSKHITAEQKAKISAALTGKHHTVKTRAKISASLSTPEARARQSAASKKYWQDPEYQAKQNASHIGKYHTAEVRAKISAANQGKHGTSKHLTA